MVVQIHNQTKKQTPEILSLKLLIDNVCDNIQLEAESINVIFISDDMLKKMHEEYLNDPTLTDVITFDLGDEHIEGELYISLDRAKEQAAIYQVPYFTEITRLIIHGILHLKGYDDISEDDRKKMKEIENQLVEKYN